MATPLLQPLTLQSLRQVLQKTIEFLSRVCLRWVPLEHESISLGLSVRAALLGAAGPGSGVRNFDFRCDFGVLLRATLSAFILTSQQLSNFDFNRRK